MPAQICFVVMPFGRKATDGPASPAKPMVVDFDHLWNTALLPVLEELGYHAIRADAEAGSVIVEEMLQRLRYAELVLADISIPNGNVYYEIGVRHAARETGCMLIGATWASRLFDLAQIRSLPYEHAGEKISDPEAEALKVLLREQLPRFAQSKTPYYVLTQAVNTQLFRAKLDDLYALQKAVQELAHVNGRQAEARAIELVDDLLALKAPPPEAVQLVVSALRDFQLWEQQVRLITGLSEPLQNLGFCQEQLQLAQSGLMRFAEAAAALEAMIQRHGATPERLGLLGGRYKRLWQQHKQEREAKEGALAPPSPAERRYLGLAIDAYERGRLLDLNEYYCASNLAALLRARGASGDEARALWIDTLVVEACRRAELLGTGDQFLIPTCFGAAFRSGDIATARDYLKRMISAVADFPRKTTRDDAELWITQAAPENRAALRVLIDELL